MYRPPASLWVSEAVLARKFGFGLRSQPPIGDDKQRGEVDWPRASCSHGSQTHDRKAQGPLSELRTGRPPEGRLIGRRRVRFPSQINPSRAVT